MLVFLESMKVYHTLDFTNRKGKITVIVNKRIPSRYLQNFHLPSNTQIICIAVNIRHC